MAAELLERLLSWVVSHVHQQPLGWICTDTTAGQTGVKG